ncbi:hypothetical protein NE865_12147 [Phthorimaea operculella]|nr:hypothetical protein NE865_12147 [Phthorimaea operculella]
MTSRWDLSQPATTTHETVLKRRDTALPYSMAKMECHQVGGVRVRHWPMGGIVGVERRAAVVRAAKDRADAGSVLVVLIVEKVGPRGLEGSRVPERYGTGLRGRAEMLTDMLDKRAKFGDSLEDYFYEKTALLNRCEIDGKRAVECIIFGIDDRAVRLGAEAAQFDEPEKLLAYLRNIRSRKTEFAANKISSKKFGNKDKPSSSNVNKSAIKCYNCKEEGHLIAKCPKPIKKCTNCSLVGHESADCFRNKNKDEPKKVLEIAKTDSCTNDKFIQNIKINGQDRVAMIDFGSDCCVVGESHVLSILGDYDRSQTTTMVGFGGAVVQSLGSAQVEIEVQGVKGTVDAIIVPDSHLKHSALFGQSYTELPHVDWYKSDGELFFTEKVDEQDIVKLYISEDCTIKPGCGFVEVKSEFGSAESELTLSVSTEDDVEGSSSKDLEQIRSEASDKIISAQERQKEQFDKSRCAPRQFKEGQLVRVERDVGQKGSQKLVPKCFGPYRISKVLPNDRYEVEDTPITKKKGKSGYKGVFSVDKIYPWLSFQALESDTDSSENESGEESNTDTQDN